MTEITSTNANESNDNVPDAAVREAIISSKSKRIFVEAGAGTGKSTTLVRRIIERIRTGAVRVEKIVAITFTEAAASELRERILHQLEEAAVSQHFTSEEQARFLQARQNLDSATIATIHGFCSRVLGQFGVEAALPLSVSVMNDIEERVWVRRIWHNFAAKYLLRDGLDSLDEPDGLKKLLDFGLLLGAQPSQLRELAQLFVSNWHELPRVRSGFEIHSIEELPTLDLGSIQSALDVAIKSRRECNDVSDKFAIDFDLKVLPWAEGFAEVVKTASRSGIAPSTPLETFSSVRRVGQKANWPEGALDVARETAKALHEKIREQNGKLADWYLRNIAALLATEIEDEVRKRIFGGVLSYADLIILTRDLIRTNDEVRAALKNQIDDLYVDEFQDTDSLQLEIIDLLCNDDEPGVGPNRFTVGDPKQSIYRFRRAEPSLFADVRNRASTGDVQILNANFRTLTPVVSWVNSVFGALLNEGENARISDSIGVSLAPRRVGDHGTVTVLGHVCDAAATRRFIHDVRSDATAQIAKLCRELVEKSLPVSDGAGGLRPARFGDIAILISSRTALKQLQSALDAEAVAHRFESRSDVWDSQEVRDLVAILAAVADPFDSIATVATLRSSLFVISDVELAEWKASGGSWSFLSQVLDSQRNGRVAAALSQLKELNTLSTWMTVEQLLRQISDRFAIFERATVKSRVREPWARIRFVFGVAQVWDRDERSGLRGFLNWARAQIAAGAQGYESVSPDLDDDAVRILTIHASKGLEFPIAIVGDLGSDSASSDSVRAIWQTDKGPAIRVKGATSDTPIVTDGFSEIWEREKAQDKAEQVRLAYVACTRARDHLIVSLHRANENGLAANVARVVHELNADSVLDDIAAIEFNQDPLQQGGETATARDDIKESGGEQHPSATKDGFAAILADASLPVAISGSATSKRFGMLTGISPEWSTVLRIRDAAMTFGTVVHEVLEHQDLSGPVNEQLCAEVAQLHDVSDRVGEVIASVQLAIDTPLVREAATVHHWRELALSGSVNGYVLHGTADLVFEHSDGLAIIDWKTDFVDPKNDGSNLLGYYKWQLLNYASTASQATGKTVTKLAICLISPDQNAPRVLEIEDPVREMELFRNALGEWKSVANTSAMNGDSANRFAP